MHYDFKRKLNKIDSQSYRNLLIPEIDQILNEAQEIFVKMVAKPRFRSQLGFEISQRSIDDIRVLVEEDVCQVPSDNMVSLPDNYWHYVSSYVTMSKGGCSNIKGSVFIRQHDDTFENSPFDRSSFEWRVVNATFYKNGVKFYTNDDFTIDSFCLSYIRNLVYIHNAEDFRSTTSGGTYDLPSGVTLTGSVDCELPVHTHREIVDLAVLIATGELENPNSYQLKQDKLRLNNLN